MARSLARSYNGNSILHFLLNSELEAIKKPLAFAYDLLLDGLR